MGTTWTEEGFFKEFEGDGEDVVRVKLDAGIYGDPRDRKYGMARSWLRGKDQSRQAEAERQRHAFDLEHLQIAKSTRYVALAAAIAATLAIVVTMSCVWINLISH